MTRRKYRRNISSKETTITLIITVVVVMALGFSSLPQALLVDGTVLLLCVVVLAAMFYYFVIRRKQIAYQEGLRQLKIDDVDSMSGVEFEKYVADLFRRQGYMFEITAASGDMGVDLVVVKGGIRTAIQTKRYSRPVNQAAVREAIAGMKQYKCTKSMVVTNSTFTKLAKQLALVNECELVDRVRLVGMIASY